VSIRKHLHNNLLTHREQKSAYLVYVSIRKHPHKSLLTHLTKVAPAVVGRRVDETNMPLCVLPNVEVKRINVTDMPKCSAPSRKCVNMTNKSDSLVISPNTVKRTVTAIAVDQSKGSCLTHRLHRAKKRIWKHPTTWKQGQKDLYSGLLS
jgi:hypothetical protein